MGGEGGDCGGCGGSSGTEQYPGGDATQFSVRQTRGPMSHSVGTRAQQLPVMPAQCCASHRTGNREGHCTRPPWHVQQSQPLTFPSQIVLSQQRNVSGPIVFGPLSHGQ